ncbi:glycosyltransferase family 2 protein [Paenibacillus humicola]|uniref:glycosyltransferase family 2 protein n=1 Tax=Paenibacillus humicola TaxID=3110540 RepID=UPI00237A6400|nr:glycosyltransferase family A protein [Paenibacillus humicola]
MDKVITVIACTMRSSFIDNVFENYDRQLWKDKQMIIVLNNDKMDVELYRQRARQYRDNEIKVFQLPQKYKLGKCMNYAISQADGGIIAKFDDDDYYGPRYLQEAARAIKRGKASVVGKHTAYLYFTSKRALMVFRRGGEWKYRRSIKGGTLVFRKSVWRKVRFPEFKKVGSDSGWVGRCIRRGFRVYSVSKRYYVCIRRKNSGSHTQKKSVRRYMAQCTLVRKTRNFKRYVN